MLRTPAPFPQAGSFALCSDVNQPVGLQRAELVRVLRLAGTMVFIAFPLRVGASGNTVVPLADLIDATPLTRAEEHELADLQRELLGKKRPNATKATRCEALRERAIWSPLLTVELRKLEALDARHDRRTGASNGLMLSSVA